MEETVKKIIEHHFHEVPVRVERMTMGICNEVYAAHLEDKEVIVRLSTREQNLIGSHYYIPLFRSLGIKVPEMLAEDYMKTVVPFAYQIQTRIPGKDLGDVIEQLTDKQLGDLAHEIASIIQKVSGVPASNQFGDAWGSDGDFSDTLTERIKMQIDKAKARGAKTGVMDAATLQLIDALFAKQRPYFDSVKARLYYGDICSKNVMIHNGAFSGLVDLDNLAQGDPLESVGRIKISWYGTRYGKIYTDAVMEELKLTNEQRRAATAYALLHAICWACENGIKFNENTKAVVDQERRARDKQRIQAIAAELTLR